MSLQVQRTGNVTTFLLDRPHKAHAYNRAMLEALDKALQILETHVLVIGSTGNGAFCGGADLDEMKNATPEDAHRLYSQEVFQRIAESPAVSIAAIQGPAIAGGFELALACDLRVGGPNAQFALPEIRLGMIPSAGGCTRLPLLIGASRARSVILGGEPIHAQKAIDWGVIARLVEDPLHNAQDWATDIAEHDPEALCLAKKVLRGGIEDRLELERLAQTVLYDRKKNPSNP